MTARLWIALALVLAVLSGAGAWTVRGWRADAAIERMRATVAEGAAIRPFRQNLRRAASSHSLHTSSCHS